MKRFLLAAFILILVLTTTIASTLAVVFAVQSSNKDVTIKNLQDEISELKQQNLLPTVTPTLSPEVTTTPSATGCSTSSADERIVVTKPCANDLVGGSVLVKGFATGLFEGNMIVDVLDSSKNVLQKKVYTLAGEPGSTVAFTETFVLAPVSVTSGYIKFYSQSAMDGSDIHVVEVPVRF